MKRGLIFLFVFFIFTLGACRETETAEPAPTTTVAEKIGETIGGVAGLQTAVATMAPPATNTPPTPPTPVPTTPDPTPTTQPEGWIGKTGAPMPPVAPIFYEWWGGAGFTPFFDNNQITVIFFHDSQEGSDRFLIWNGSWNYSATYQTYDVWTFQEDTEIKALEDWALQYIQFMEKNRPEGWQTPRLLEGGGQGIQEGGVAGQEGGGAGTP